MNNNKKELHNDKYILDACCGSRMFWFDKSNKNTVFMDNRTMALIKYGEIVVY